MSLAEFQERIVRDDKDSIDMVTSRNKHPEYGTARCQQRLRAATSGANTCRDRQGTCQRIMGGYRHKERSERC